MKAFFSMFSGHNATESLNDTSVSYLTQSSTSGSTSHHDISSSPTAGEVVNEKNLKPAQAVLLTSGSEPLVQQRTQFSRRRRDRSCVIAMNAHIPSGMARADWTLQDYGHFLKVYNGYASSVYQAVCRHSGQRVALKVYEADKLHVISQHQLMREARMHPMLAHPNIVKMYASFRQESYIVLVMEWCNGGSLLEKYLEQGSHMPEPAAAEITKQMASALSFLHSKSIVHRDVKLENVVLKNRLDEKSGKMVTTYKLADLGLSINLLAERAVTRAGTTDYMAPEVLRCPTKETPEENKDREDLAYGYAADIWSLGVLTFELLNGRPPFPRSRATNPSFHNEMERQRLDRMLSSMGEPLYHVAASEPAKQLIKHCLLPRDQRSTASELLNHPWLNAETSRRERRASADASQAVRLPEVDAGPIQPTLQPSSTLRPVSLPGISSVSSQWPMDPSEVWMKRGNISDDAIVHQSDTADSRMNVFIQG